MSGSCFAPAASRRLPTCCTWPNWRGNTKRAAAFRFVASSTNCALPPRPSQAAEAPILEEGSDGVRMMTVHKAKGLEFPVVILADPTCKLSPLEASRWIAKDDRMCALKLGGWAPIDLVLHGEEERAREQAEAQRLAYVAATRARDLLVVPVIGDGAVRRGLARSVDAGRVSAGAGAPQSVPRGGLSGVSVEGLGDESSRRRSRRGPTPSLPARYEFGEHRPAANREARTGPRIMRSCGGIRIAFTLDAVSTFGLRRDDLIVKDGDMFAVEERMADYERWRRDRAEAIENAQRPSLRVQTATAWAAAVAELGIDEEIAAASAIEVVELRRCRGPSARSAFRHVGACRARDSGARRESATTSLVDRGNAGTNAAVHRRGDPSRRPRLPPRCSDTTSWRARGAPPSSGVKRPSPGCRKTAR